MAGPKLVDFRIVAAGKYFRIQIPERSIMMVVVHPERLECRSH